MFIILFIIYLLEKAEALLLNPVHFSNIRLPVTKNHAVSPQTRIAEPPSDAFLAINDYNLNAW